MKKLICIVCPIGCHLEIDAQHNVTGNRCKRGIGYAIEEVTRPTRMVTTTVRLLSQEHPRLSVKTSKPLPKEAIFRLMAALESLTVNPPVYMHQVIMRDFEGLGVDIIATRTIPG
ncbi:MAG: DUF1667 domain-containing protein [Acholeplasmatales bacterium]|nr:MAG: DUF1667 domain-containing protein [Acholeplasmatales bacterium]